MAEQELDYWEPSVSQDGVTVAEIARADGILAPAIWFESAGNVEILPEALAFAFAETDAQRPYQHTRQVVGSIAQLLRYFIWKGQPVLDERGFRRFVTGYFAVRANGELDLCWKPLARNALEAELRNICYFSDFCELYFGYLPLIGRVSISLPPPTKHEKSFWRLLATNETDFFSHLALHRDVKQPLIKLPGRARKAGGRIRTAGMTLSTVMDLVEAERNPTFKAIWLIGLFGGPRLSEVMNLWVCDVLPGTYRNQLFPGDIFVDLPLVVIADPWASTWCGDIGDERRTREVVLREDCGLVPRPRMAETDGGDLRGKVAGFKGTRPSNTSSAMRQLFWVDEEAARMFEQTVIDVLHTRNRLPKAKLHPYLFVNSDARKPEVLGEMIALSNVRKAFERAIRRIGGTPYTSKQSPHGMRHFYTDMAREVCGGDEGAVQVCLAHRNRLSQDIYGSFDMKAMRHAMAAASPRRRQQ